MSDINYSITYRVSKGFLSNNVNANGVTASMADTGLLSQTLTLSSNAVAITTANLSSVGLAFIQNLSTATLQTAAIGIEAGGSFVGFATLRAGEPALMRLTSGTAYQAKGGAGARLRVDITEG
jgi:hypothetical protein